MTDHWRWPVALATAGGLAAAAWTIGTVGIADLARAGAAMGAGGFALLCALSLSLMAVLGAAWLAAMPGAGIDRLPLFAWARTAREASNELLPFSQIGGLFVGARTLIAAGLPPAPVAAAIIVDLTTEMASQAVVTLFGVALLAERLAGGDAALARGAWAGAAIGLVMLVGFAILQRPLLALAGRLAGRVSPASAAPLAAVAAELERVYRHRARVAASLALNLAGWVMSAAIGWATLAMMGSPVPFGRMMALESLVFAARSAAFVVPGAIGVQEAAYLLLAGAFGIDPRAAVALSLAKRARDIAIGVPVLIAWQARGWRTRAA